MKSPMFFILNFVLVQASADGILAEVAETGAEDAETKNG